MTFTDGLYSEARHVPASPHRIGGTIVPSAIVFHTTDTLGGMKGMLERWAEGAGPCAHFMLGRDATQGLAQMVPINRNGEHAGAAPPAVHGWFVDTHGKLVHPNTVAIGIEVVCGGKLRDVGGRAMYGQTPVAETDVYRDEHGKPWHRITEYQLDELGKLIDALRTQLAPCPFVSVKPSGDYKANGVAPWAEMIAPWLVGHTTLDPVRKTDPGPQGMAWARKRYA